MKISFKSLAFVGVLVAASLGLSGCGSSSADEAVDTSKIVPMSKSPVHMDGGDGGRKTLGTPAQSGGGKESRSSTP